MPQTIFTPYTMPQSGQELKERLNDALNKKSSLDDFVQIVQDLTRLEMRHQLDSEEFFNRFQQGKMGDEMEFIRWANKYEIYQEMKADMEGMFSLLHQYAIPEVVV
jgi:hypothetical protein